MPNHKRVWTLLLCVGALAALPAPATTQSGATLQVAENFRREPNGVVLARLTTGTPVEVVGREGGWTEIELGGWVWLRSVQRSEDPAFDLVVSAEGGENLRAGPSGDVLARLEEGALLNELDRDPGWARVTRSGWVWSASLAEDGAAGAGPMIQPPAPGFDGPAAQRPGGFVTVGEGAAILTAPDGDTLAMASPDSDLQVVGRQGNWVRVRVEGWTWMPAAEESTAVAGVGALEPGDLTADPSAYNGRVVSWTLQFISLERAEVVRTDFREGEPFLLTRFAGPEGPFVYVALPPERLTEVEGLVPLERISVTARIRTGASVLTGTTIVDLVSIERSREAP